VSRFVELADEESGRVWYGLICLPVKGDTWTRWTKREAPRPHARIMQCLNHNLHRGYGQHYHHPPSHISDTPSLSSWQAGPLRTSRTDRQTFAHFLIRGASYTLIPKPYLENAQVITFLDNAHPQSNTSVPPPACTSDWQERISIG
jgi:hypothetical protein